MSYFPPSLHIPRRQKMDFSLVAWWKKDTALNSYIFCLFLIGVPFTLFGTYVIYQLQVVGYLIGADADGQPCLLYCLVPFGSRQMDLNSVLLYLNAMGFGLGGALAVFISAYADWWKNKSLLMGIFIVLYGAIAVPAYWLRDNTLKSFNALMALYVVYAVITYLITVLLNMYIPHCMRAAMKNDPLNLPNLRQPLSDEERMQRSDSKTLTAEINTPEEVTIESKATTPRQYGFMMSVWGSISTTAGGIIALILVIILSQTLPADADQTSGLLMTTVAGFLTLVGSIVAFLGLPAVPPKSDKTWEYWWLELFTPFRDIFRRKNMFVLLFAYTIYTDTVFALASVTGQLYFLEVQPNTLEFSLYSLAGNLSMAICTAGFYYLQIWKPPFRLECWLILGYALILIVPVWGCIGLADNIDFGFKNRWEFYVQNFIFYLSGSIVNPTFRVLFAEFIPTGSEIEWFGLQVILSCATSWVSYITNAPLQAATHQLRFPLVLCLIFLIIPVVLEILRCKLRLFDRDRLQWKEIDAGTTDGSARDIDV